MSQDLVLTGDGMPSIEIGDSRYPLLFSVGAIKQWAEYKKIDVTEALKGWAGDELNDEDLKAIFKIALECGEFRRKMFARNSADHVIDDDLIDLILSLFHPRELWYILSVAWNEPPVGKQDPPQMVTPDPSPGTE